MSAGDCGLRCYTERKNYCKDLHKWGKNLLYMIGLECVAKKLTNRRSWEKISPFLKPDTDDLEKENCSPVDWKPADFCPVCSGRRFTAMDVTEEQSERKEDAVKQQLENSEERLPPTSGNHNTGSINPKLNFDFLFSNSGIPDASLTAPLFTNPFSFFGFGSTAYLQQLLQWSTMMNPAMYSASPQSFLPFLTNSFDLQQNQNGLASSGSSSATPSKSSQPTPSLPGDQPLDLSQKSNKNATTKSGTKFQPATAAGVGDFLAKGLPGFGKSAPGGILNASGNGGSANGNNGSKRNYTQLDLEAAVKDIRSGRLGTRRASVVYGIPRSTLRNKIYKLEAAEESGSVAAAKRAKRTGIAISSSPIDPSLSTPAPEEENNPQSQKPVPGSPPLDAESSSGQKKPSSSPDSPFKECVSSILAKSQAARLTDELASINLRWSALGLCPPKSAAEALIQQQWYRSPVVNAAVTVASQEAFRQCWMEDDSGESPKTLPKQCKHLEGERERTETPSGAASGSGSESPTQRKSSGKDNGGDAWKKSRPKRGQYRKYDKNALDEAVRSVRRGEMSVHRAGSYYGVPHSTLEYKVKERNLLRPKKKDASRKAAEESEELDKQRKSVSPKKAGGVNRKKKNEEGTSSGQVSPLSKEIMDYLQEAKDESPRSSQPFINGNSTAVSPSASEPVSIGNQQTVFRHPFSFGNRAEQQAFFASDMMRRLQAEASNPSLSRHELNGSDGADSNCATQ